MLQYRAAYRELTPRNRSPSLPTWLLENKREVTKGEEGGERILLSAPRKTFFDPSLSLDLFHRIHAVYADGCLWPNQFFHPIQFWDMMRARSTGRERSDTLNPFTAEAELTLIDPATVLSKELLAAEPADHSWAYGDVCDYLALSDSAHHWGIDVVCLGSGILPGWWDRPRDGSHLAYVENVIVFGEDYPGCRSARFAQMRMPLVSRREPNRPCFLLKMHNRVTERR